jgi:purine catabolism regulator
MFLEDRPVRWVAVIEWPVEDFVAPGELVLTTGLGCDSRRFCQLTAEIAESGAAALCVGVGSGAPHPAVPRAALEVAERLGMPIVEMPWAVRFADVLRAVADKLLSARYVALTGEGERLPSGLAAALLRRDGLPSVAQAAERMLDRPVLILDGSFAPLALGPLAAASKDDLTSLSNRSSELGQPALAALRRQLNGDDVTVLPNLQALGLSSVLVAPAAAEGEVLGYVVALGDGRQANLLTAESQALRYAGIAAAIELLHRRAAAEAEARVHGDFLWELAAGELPRSELAAKASLLGYPIRQQYRVLLGRDESDERNAIDEVVRQARRLGSADRVLAGGCSDQALVLVPADPPSLLEPAQLAKLTTEQLPSRSVSWGIAEGTCGLLDLASGARQARRALEVGRALRGPGNVADGTELQPFLMMWTLASDDEASKAVTGLLGPLLRYDGDGTRELLRTLRVYLEENGNTSSAARRLVLNRHSLIYRLRKIESLTGRDLSDHDDRFAFELSLRLHELSDSSRSAEQG